MAQAAKGAGSQGKKAAAAAATDAYEDNLDLAVTLGWAFVDRVSFEVLTPTPVQSLCVHHETCWAGLASEDPLMHMCCVRGRGS